MRLKKRQSESEKLIENLRLIDDRFMNVCLRDNIECVQLMLRIIMDKPDLVVTKMKTQEVVKSLTGRDVEFDITATDSAGKIYDIEMQRSAGGADFRRARYHASVIDSKTLGHGVPFAKLSEAFVIFITENDVLGGGKPIYHIDRRVKEMKNKLFNDGSHIIYVNASSPNLKTALGKLMFDLCCKDPDKMYYQELANTVRYFKRTRKGQEIMASEYDAWVKGIADEAMEIGVKKGEEIGIKKGERRGEKRGEKKSQMEIALKLLERGGMAVEEIAELTGLSLKNVQKLVTQKAA